MDLQQTAAEITLGGLIKLATDTKAEVPTARPKAVPQPVKTPPSPSLWDLHSFRALAGKDKGPATKPAMPAPTSPSAPALAKS